MVLAPLILLVFGFVAFFRAFSFADRRFEGPCET